MDEGLGNPGTPGDLWAYSFTTHLKRRVTTDHAKDVLQLPRFFEANTVSFVLDNGHGAKIETAPLGGGRSTVLFSTQGSIEAYAWSPDRQTVAYYGSSADYGSPVRLSTYQPGTGRNTILHTFPGIDGGRDWLADDETSVAWSPDGSRLLLVDTGRTTDGTDATTFVFNRGGTLLHRGIVATDARWSLDGCSVYYRAYYNGRYSKPWFKWNVSSNAKTPLGLVGESAQAVLSPDGSALAYERGDGIAVFDMATKITRQVAHDVVHPQWISPNTLVGTNVRGCEMPNCDPAQWWWSSNTTSVVDTRSGKKSPLPLSSALDADVLYN